MIDNFKKILSPFLKAGLKVLSELTDMKFERKEVYSFTGNKSLGDVKIEIDIQGDIKSRVVFDMPRDFAFKLAKIMIGDDNLTDDVELLQSAILELGNMISGNAMGFLEEYKIHADIKTPTAHIGKEKTLFTSGTQIGVIEFNSEIGPFNIYVVIQEEETADNPGILLFHIPDVVTNHVVEFFLPKGIPVLATGNEFEAFNALKHENISLLFVNQITAYNFDINSFLEKALSLKPQIKVLFFTIQVDWDRWIQNSAKILTSYPNTVIGYVPRAIDSFRIIKTLAIALEKIGVKLGIKRKAVQADVFRNDKIKAVIYPQVNPDNAKDTDVVHADILELSLNHATLGMPGQSSLAYKISEIIPRVQFNLKGNVIRTKCQVQEITGNKLKISLNEIAGDGVLKLAAFIHQKLNENLKTM